MTFFLKNTFKATAKKFDLTERQLKVCMTLAYKEPTLKNMRKDARTKRLWNTEEYLTMLQLCGLVQRSTIAKILDRGTSRVIKERLVKLGVSSKNINGLTLKQTRSLLGNDVKLDPIHTTAGSINAVGTCFCFKIMLWTELETLVTDIDIPEVFKNFIYCMSDFQSWLWNTDKSKVKDKINGTLQAIKQSRQYI